VQANEIGEEGEIGISKGTEIVRGWTRTRGVAIERAYGDGWEHAVDQDAAPTAQESRFVTAIQRAPGQGPHETAWRRS